MTVARHYATLFLVALGVRLAYLHGLQDSLLFAVLLGDGAAFDLWGREIAAGNWLGDDVFWQAPLYPYGLGVLYRLFGHELMLVRVLQAVLGALACVLLADTTRRACAGSRLGSVSREGLTAGYLLAFYAPAIFFEGLIQKTSAALFLLVLLLHCLLRLRDDPRVRPCAAAGLALGCLMLLREHLAVLAPVVIGWVGFLPGQEGRKRLMLAVVLALSFAAPLAVVGLRNRAVGGELVLGTNFGPNLYIGNHAEADGLYRPLVQGRGNARFERSDASAIAADRTGHALTPAEVSDFWRDEALAWMRADPGAALALFARKLHLVLHATEWMDSQSFTVYRDRSRVLQLLAGPMRFGVIAPLALLGLVLLARERRRLALFYVSLPAVALGIAVFFVFARFRLSLLPFLLPFTAHAGLEIGRRVRAREWRGLVLPGVLLAAFAAFVHWPLGDLEFPRADTYNNLGSALALDGREHEAVRMFERARDARPDYAAPHYNLGQTLVATGAFEAALPELARAAALEPGYAADAGLSSATAELALGRERAAETRLAALAADPRTPATVLLQGGVLMRQRGNSAAAERLYRAALARQPDFAAAHNNLGYLYDLAGRGSEAVREYEAALAADPGWVDALVNFGWLRAASASDELRNGAEALEFARQALERVDGRGWNLLDLEAAALAELGRYAEALERLEEALLNLPAGEGEVRAGLEARQELYRSGRPYRMRVTGE